MDQFQELTNGPLTVSNEDLYNYTIEKLDDFDRLKEMTGAEPNISPYKDLIEFTTPDGKLINIPRNIQVKAVTDWMTQKGILQNDQLVQEEPVPNQPIVKRHITVYKSSSPYNKLFWVIVVGLLIFLIVLYFKNKSA